VRAILCGRGIEQFGPAELPRGPSTMTIRAADVAFLDLCDYKAPGPVMSEAGDGIDLGLKLSVIKLE
jgi:hypothetical protein